ncbi:MAG: transposase [Verrucomicrobiota bacterium]
MENVRKNMAHRFKNIERNTPMLLPPDLRDWVAEDDLVHFVIAAVERLPLAGFTSNERGCGDEQYPPHLMLALLVYCYANGVFSSRRIERATYRDVAVRYLCGDTHPDHDTICAFRRNNLEAFAAAFVEVLELAREMKLLRLGSVSSDGTHIRANASKDKNVTYERAQQLRTQLRSDVDELLRQAEQSDRQDEDPQKLPAEIARREKLLGKMDEACRQLEHRAKERAEAERAEYERKVAAREQRDDSRKGPVPKPPPDTPEGHEQVNLTDADAHLMRKSKRESYTQSYNAQAVVDAGGSQLIVGQRVSTCASDANELEPDLESIPAVLGEPRPRRWPIAATSTAMPSSASARPRTPRSYMSAFTARTPTQSAATTTVHSIKSSRRRPSSTLCSLPWRKSSRPGRAAKNTESAPARSNRSSASSNTCSDSGSSCCGG